MRLVRSAVLASASALAIQCGSIAAHADTFTLSSGPINVAVPDNNLAGISTMLNVPALGVVTDLNVSVTYAHVFVGETSFSLLSPAGTNIVFQGSFVDNSSLDGTYEFDDEASTAWVTALGVIPDFGKLPSGSYNTTVSGNPLSGFDGEVATGIWTLHLVDHVSGDAGLLASWSLIFELDAVAQAKLGPTIPAIISGDASAIIGSFADRANAIYSGGVEPAADVVNPYLPGGTGGLWMRLGGAAADGEGDVTDLFVPVSATYDKTLWFGQAGLSHVLYERANKKWIGSVFGHYSESDADVSDALGPAGNVGTKGYGAGYSSTWLFTSGLYIDSVGLAHWQDIDVSAVGGDEGSTDAFTLASSTELGMSFPLSEVVSLVPQVQGIYQRVDIDSFTDSGGTTYSFSDNDSLVGRAGIGVKYSNTEPDSDHRVQADITASVLKQFMDGGSTAVNGTELGFDGDEVASWQVAVGFNMTPVSNGFGLGLRANYRDAFESDGESSYGGNVTLSWQW